MAYYAGVAIAANVINQNMRQRRNNVYRTGIASLEDTEVALRINSAEIDTLVDEYHLWRRAQFGINASHNRSSARMVSFLAYLARGGYFHQCARTEGVAKTTLMLHVKEVASFFSCEARKYIELPIHRLNLRRCQQTCRILLITKYVVLYCVRIILERSRIAVGYVCICRL